MNQKEYFQKAYEGEPVIISRPRNENVVLISVEEYNEMKMAKRFAAYYEEVASLGKKALEMEEKVKLSEKDLMKFYKGFLNLIKKKSDGLFLPLTKQEMIDKLGEARKHAEEGKVKSADQVYEEMRALYGI
ncbi:MAG: hypothetical protein J5476_06050 [Lachnospiraceae bacterium]|nr:hypothetical protein [Lachnospiraceae bacterium]